MISLGERIHEYIDSDDAVRLLAKYYSGSYTGSRFDTAPQLESPDPNRFTAHDIAAVATLSVPLPGSAVAGLFDRETDFVDLLSAVPTDVDLIDASEDHVKAVFAVQDELDKVAGIGHVTRSKLLAHKRPHLVPIRDQHVLTALIGRDHGPFTVPLRDALAADPSIVERLNALKSKAGIAERISAVRVLDVIVWMAAHGDGQVKD